MSCEYGWPVGRVLSSEEWGSLHLGRTSGPRGLIASSAIVRVEMSRPLFSVSEARLITIPSVHDNRSQSFGSRKSRAYQIVPRDVGVCSLHLLFHILHVHNWISSLEVPSQWLHCSG